MNLDRIDINTDSLRSNFIEIYKDFFSSNELVVSSPNVLSWYVGLGKYFNKLKIRQKVPAKILCGVNKIENGEIKFNSKTFYDSINQNFYCKTQKAIYYRKKEIKISNFLKSLISQNGESFGLEINILIESSEDRGYGFTCITCSLLIICVFILLGKIKIEDLSDYNNFQKSSIFKEVFSLTWKLKNNIKQSGNITCSNSFISLCNCSLPIVFMTNHADEEPSNIDYNNIQYTAKGVKSMFGIDGDIEDLPIDYGLISTGAEINLEEVGGLYDQYNYELSILQNQMKDLTQNIKIRNEKHEFTNPLTNLVAILGFQLLNGFKEIFLNTHNKYTIAEFINIVRRNGLLSGLFSSESSSINLFKKLFFQIKALNEEEIGIIPISHGSVGGAFLFVTKYNKSRNTMGKVIDEMKTRGYINTVLEYASWIDGNTSDGLTIEQNIQNGIYSSYLNKNDVLYIDNQGKKYIGLYDEVSKSNPEGLLLDSVNNKIYYNSKSLNSKQLHSQAFTIDILGSLIEKVGKDVSNMEYTRSSYTRNKNEMLGKIILPIVRLVEKDKGNQIPLLCKGSLNNFYIKLNHTDFKISLIKKIF